MATWEDQTSPLSKFENSPAESFLSTPGEMYPSLFAPSTPPAPSTVNPLEMMTPPSGAGDMKPDPDAALVSALATTVPLVSTPAATPAAASQPAEAEKKPVKKRKSWGQVLPEPKTNLPPRKRAKTEDEKEQRRVERVLRNRRAAQSSRERKRQEVEALEKRNEELEARLLEAQNDKIKLMDELRYLRQQAGVVTRTPMPLDNLHTDSPTLSKELFSSQDLSLNEASLITVDPSSLSPKPMTEATGAIEAAAGDGKVAGDDAPSSDLAQHPAVSKVGGGASGLGFFDDVGASDADHHHLAGFDLSAAYDADRFVIESGLISSDHSVDLENDHLGSDATKEFDDIMQFLTHGTEPSNTLADLGNPFADPENPFSSEAFNLQPESGASTQGCDDGGIAVGGI